MADSICNMRRNRTCAVLLGVFCTTGHAGADGSWGGMSLRGLRAAPLASQLPLRGADLGLRGLRGGGKVASPGKRALDGSGTAAYKEDGSDTAADKEDLSMDTSFGLKNSQISKRMTVRGGQQDDAAKEDDEVMEALWGRGDVDEVLAAKRLKSPLPPFVASAGAVKGAAKGSEKAAAWAKASAGQRGADEGRVGGAAKGAAEEGEDTIDEELYSRQLYVLGHDAMKKMQKSNILLIGVAGLGVEVAKNLALAGVKSLTLHDPRNVRVDDLSAQFYCQEEHVGQNRAVVSLERLASLNRHVQMKILDGPVNRTTIEQYSLVICTDSPFGECVMVNDACRAAGVKFIMVQARGFAGNIFVDLGAAFEVSDVNGENPAQVYSLIH